MLSTMKAARAKVVKGRIVTRAKFPEGAELTVVLREKAPPIDLTPDEEEAMLRGIASIKAGRGIPLDEFRAILRRL
jgi:hypothetical protein